MVTSFLCDLWFIYPSFAFLCPQHRGFRDYFADYGVWAASIGLCMGGSYYRDVFCFTILDLFQTSKNKLVFRTVLFVRVFCGFQNGFTSLGVCYLFYNMALYSFFG